MGGYHAIAFMRKQQHINTLRCIKYIAQISSLGVVSELIEGVIGNRKGVFPRHGLFLTKVLCQTMPLSWFSISVLGLTIHRLHPLSRIMVISNVLLSVASIAQNACSYAER